MKGWLFCDAFFFYVCATAISPDPIDTRPDVSRIAYTSVGEPWAANERATIRGSTIYSISDLTTTGSATIVAVEKPGVNGIQQVTETDKTISFATFAIETATASTFEVATMQNITSGVCGKVVMPVPLLTSLDIFHYVSRNPCSHPIQHYYADFPNGTPLFDDRSDRAWSSERAI
jgi:hypothetical protein